MIKKLLSVILCFCMAAVLLPFAAFAETGAQAGMPELTVNDTVKTVFFGGYEFYVIGYNGVGVHSAKNDNTVTLFMKVTDKTDYKYKITSTFRMSYPEHVENSWPVHGGDSIFYAGNPTGLAKWDNPNEYAGSTLQQLLEKTASDLDDAEEGLIIARDLTPGDGIGGHSISGQKYWALSLDEFNQIDNADIISFGMDALCWLRTPYINTIAYCGGENGAVNNISIKKYLGVRFAFNLDLSSVIFTSAASGGKSAATVSNGFQEVTAPQGPLNSRWRTRAAAISLPLQRRQTATPLQ